MCTCCNDCAAYGSQSGFRFGRYSGESRSKHPFGGEVEKDSWQFIVWESRVPQCITALLCGTALSASGLMLQTVFSNPLADSSILGISSGASLGVALVLLAGGGSIIAGEFVLSGFLSVVAGAFAGAALVMAIILSLSAIIKNTVMLLIAGIMIGYVVSSIISLLNFFSTAEGVHSFVLWEWEALVACR